VSCFKIYSVLSLFVSGLVYTTWWIRFKMVLFMVCVNSDMIKLWTICEDLSKLYVASRCPYGCSNWVREESNFSNSNLRLYKPCFEIAVVMTNHLLWYYKLHNTHIKCHGKLHDHTKLWYSQGYFVQDNFCANI
jgi:hypothetical protein